MRTKLINKHNPQSFLDDLKRVREVMVTQSVPTLIIKS